MLTREQGPSLRGMVSAVTAAISVVALVVAGSLILLTSWQRNAAFTMDSVVQSIHLIENVEVDLLAHGRAPSSPDAARLESTIRRDFANARRHVITAEEASVYADADRALREHFDAPKDLAKTRAAFEAMERLVDLNLAQAHDAFESARRVDRIADMIAIALASSILLLASWLLIWLRRSALSPIVSLSDALGRFARGDFETRVEKSGPREIKQVAQGFNSMAESIQRQRDNRLTFLAGVAHDLRTPVSTLRLSLSSMGKEPDRTARVVTMAQRQIDRLERMLGDLVDSTQIEAGRLELRKSRLDLSDIARSTFELFVEPDAPNRLKLDVCDRPVHVFGDPVRLEQVATNLVSNALKYSPNGGEVLVSVREQAGYGLLSVRDEGVGITEAEMATLFEPFRRAGRLKEQVAGAGLGLSVARRIVVAHGGSIDVESAPGRGSTFRVCVPLEPREVAVTHAP
jgi:two-component system, OmpR family, sensor histidine kinase MtrB